MNPTTCYSQHAFWLPFGIPILEGLPFYLPVERPSVALPLAAELHMDFILTVLCSSTSVWFVYANLFSHSSFIYIGISIEDGWLSGKESACKAGDAGSVPRLGRPLEKEMATNSSIFCLGNPTD